MALSDPRLKEILAVVTMTLKARSLTHDEVRSMVSSHVKSGGFAPQQQPALVEEILKSLGPKMPGNPRAEAAVSGVRSTGRQTSRAPYSDKQRDLVRRTPYRFVTLGDTVTPAPGQTRQAWNFLPVSGGVSGSITCEWEFETPVLVGQQNGIDDVSRPMTLLHERDYVIPGATWRGAVRAAMEIVTRARLSKINAHHTYGVRDFSHPLFKEGDGSQRLAWPILGAGWLRLANTGDPKSDQGDSRYVIEPARKKMVRIRALPRAFTEGETEADRHKDWLCKKLLERYEAANQKEGNRLLFGKEQACWYFVKDNDALDSREGGLAADFVRASADPQGGEPGWFVFSDWLSTVQRVAPDELERQEETPSAGAYKRREYVFFDLPNAQPVRLTEQAWDRFWIVNSKPARNNRTPDGSLKALWPTLEDGGRIPVFFSGSLENQNDAREPLVFGLTRLFKQPHRNSVADIRDRERDRAGKPLHQPRLDNSGQHVDADMVEALFGHVYERSDLGLAPEASINPAAVARKGRLLFGFGRLDPETPAVVSDELRTLMTGPRASYAPFYLSGPIKDWTDEGEVASSSDKARLAGRKRYPPRYPQPPGRDKGWQDLRERLDTQKIIEVRKDGSVKRASDRDETVSALRFLRPVHGDTLRFRQTIRLHNLNPAEVGALLFAITHGADQGKRYRHMIGRGKPFGAGQAVIKSLSIALAGHDVRGDKLVKQPDPSWDWEKPWLAAGSQAMTPYLREFAEHMRASSETCKNWPFHPDSSRCLPEIAEWLGASDPSKTPVVPTRDRTDAESFNQARLYPPLKAYGEVRDTVKAIVGAPDPRQQTPHRLLAAEQSEGTFPWLDTLRATKR